MRFAVGKRFFVFFEMPPGFGSLENAKDVISR